MEEYDSDNDLDRLLDDDVGDAPREYADVSGDEAIEDNTYNHEETGGEMAPSHSKPIKEKKVVLNPQPKLNFESLQGPKGLLALNELFKDHKFRGNGHEMEDFSEILKKLEQWSFRLFPKFHFEDTLRRLETLGKKREVQVYLRKIRNGVLDDDVVRQVDDDEDAPKEAPAVSDPYDDLIRQQINNSRFDDLLDQQVTQTQSLPKLTDEQLARIERNRKLALERKMQVAAEALTPCDDSSGMDVVNCDSSSPPDMDVDYSDNSVIHS